MSNVIVSFEEVTKEYNVGKVRTDSLRDAIPGLLRRVRRKPEHHNDSVGKFRAIQGVSFELREGEALGIVGNNGAGKSTILKLVTGVTYPTAGTVSVRGRISSLIELGAGFHPDLTGRDNVYLNGAILGLSRAAIRARFDEIVAFAEIEQFIDIPVKRYSSGMFARLGFAVAAHMDPDILVVDEVLSVGDAGFQDKSVQRIVAMVKSNKSVLFVSHNLQAVEAFCDRVAWMEKGMVRMIDKPSVVMNAYLNEIEELRREEMQRARLGIADRNQQLNISGVRLLNRSGEETHTFEPGDDITVEVDYEAASPIRSPHFTVGATDGRGNVLFLASMLADGAAPAVLEGSGTVACTFACLPLTPRTYQFWGSVRGSIGHGDLIGWQMLTPFTISEGGTFGNPTQGVTDVRETAPIYVAHDWQIA